MWARLMAPLGALASYVGLRLDTPVQPCRARTTFQLSLSPKAEPNSSWRVVVAHVWGPCFTFYILCLEAPFYVWRLGFTSEDPVLHLELSGFRSPNPALPRRPGVWDGCAPLGCPAGRTLVVPRDCLYLREPFSYKVCFCLYNYKTMIFFKQLGLCHIDNRKVKSSQNKFFS